MESINCTPLTGSLKGLKQSWHMKLMFSMYFPYVLETLKGSEMLKKKGINLVDETPIQCL